MSDDVASPRAVRLAAPHWLDGRLVLGVLLVLVSVVVGARVLARADSTQGVWVVTRDLAAGSTLSAGDLRAGQVRLDGLGSGYVLAAGSPPLGYVLQRAVGAGELLPRAGLVRPDAPAVALREVSVPVTPGHLPDDLRAGQQVDVYVTPARGTAGAVASGTGTTTSPDTGTPSGATGSSAATRLVLSRVTVALRPRAGGLSTGGSTGVVLSVPATDAPALVAAAQAGAVDLVRVPRAEEHAVLGATPATAAPTG